MRRSGSVFPTAEVAVSIHAPREGCDDQVQRPLRTLSGFNSRTPGGVRLAKDYFTGVVPSVSIHAPREGCDRMEVVTTIKLSIVSIHAPREGCDVCFFGAVKVDRVSIHAPREGCDRINCRVCKSCRVSIHAPREGCDLTILLIASRNSGFNSRTPGGVRQFLCHTLIIMGWFQFTHPGRGATAALAPCETPEPSFNSRTPGGVRLSKP